MGLVHSKGVEFDLTGRVDDNWNVIASYAYDDARIVSDTNLATDLSLMHFDLSIPAASSAIDCRTLHSIPALALGQIRRPGRLYGAEPWRRRDSGWTTAGR